MLGVREIGRTLTTPTALNYRTQKKHVNNYQTMIVCLMNICFPYKNVTRRSADKPWVRGTDGVRLLVRTRQRANMSGHFAQEKMLRNNVYRAATNLRSEFYMNHVTALVDTGPHDWWKNIKWA